MDHQFRNQGRLFGRYTLNRDHGLHCGRLPPITCVRERARATGRARLHAGRLRWLNETRLSFTRLRLFDVPESAFRTNVARDLGLGFAPDDPFTFGLPYFVVTNFSMVTDSPTLPQMQRDNLWHFSEGLSLAAARHTWKFGFDGSHFTMAYMQSHLARGQYTFTGAFTSRDGTPVDTGDPFADFLLGFPQTTRRNVGSTQAYLRQNTYAGYVQDDWRVEQPLDAELRSALRVLRAVHRESRQSAEPRLLGPARRRRAWFRFPPPSTRTGTTWRRVWDWRSGCRARPCFAPATASTSAPKSPPKATTWS